MPTGCLLEPSFQYPAMPAPPLPPPVHKVPADFGRSTWARRKRNCRFKLDTSLWGFARSCCVRACWTRRPSAKVSSKEILTGMGHLPASDPGRDSLAPGIDRVEVHNLPRNGVLTPLEHLIDRKTCRARSQSVVPVGTGRTQLLMNVFPPPPHIVVSPENRENTYIKRTHLHKKKRRLYGYAGLMLYSLWRSVRTPNSKRQLPAPQYPGSPSAPQRASGQSLRYPNGSVTSTEPRCWPSYLDLTNPIQGATRTQALGEKNSKMQILI